MLFGSARPRAKAPTATVFWSSSAIRFVAFASPGLPVAYSSAGIVRTEPPPASVFRNPASSPAAARTAAVVGSSYSSVPGLAWERKRSWSATNCSRTFLSFSSILV